MGKIIVITGNDSVGIKNRAKKIIEESKKYLKNNMLLEIIKADKEGMKPENIIKEIAIAINTPSFFGEEKIVWIKDFPYFNLLIGREKLNREYQELFENILESIEQDRNDGISIIIDGPKLDKRSSFYKKCQKFGKVYDIELKTSQNKDDGETLEKRILDIFKKNNIYVSDDVTEILIKSFGNNSWKLYSEIEKLICFAGDRKKITREDCFSICSFEGEEIPQWLLGDMIAKRKLDEALNIINKLLDSESTSKISLLYSIINRFNILIRVKWLAIKLNISNNISYNSFTNILAKGEIDEDIRKLHPYRAYMLFKGSNNFEVKEFLSTYQILLKANIDLVSGTTYPKFTLEKVIKEICNKNHKKYRKESLL